LGEIDVVVVLHAHGGADPETDRADQEIIRNMLDVLAASLGGFFAGERRPHRVLGADETGRQKESRQGYGQALGRETDETFNSVAGHRLKAESAVL